MKTEELKEMSIRKKMMSTKWGIENYQRMILPLIDALCEDYNKITQKEHYVLTQILCEGKTLAECGIPFDLTKQRIRQIFSKAIIEVIDNLEQMHTSFANTEELMKENSYLKNENDFLKQREEARMNSERPLLPLDKHIFDLGFSTRTYNCLSAFGIKTLRELVNLSRPDLLGMRNFGKKSLAEIEDFLNKNKIL